MAAAKVESWKKMAATTVDAFCKEFENVAKQLDELDKKRKAIQDGLEKSAKDVSKKIKLVGFDEADGGEVSKFQDAIFERVRQKRSALKNYGQVNPNGTGTKTSVEINFDIQWSKT